LEAEHAGQVRRHQSDEAQRPDDKRSYCRRHRNKHQEDDPHAKEAKPEPARGGFSKRQDFQPADCDFQEQFEIGLAARAEIDSAGRKTRTNRHLGTLHFFRISARHDILLTRKVILIVD
jgi:hypothetical protein